MADGLKFTPLHIRAFMGGDFVIGQPKTVAALRKALREIDEELATWGDATEVNDIHLDSRKQNIQVNLKHGLPE